MSKPARRHPQGRPVSMKEAALKVVKILQSEGYVALFAGGCVRDMLMGNEPHDYDVATSAKPDDVIRLFRRTQQVGAQFGVVLVRIGRHPIEVATFRTDLSYQDGRRPSGVEFSSPEEDARRRDFTINGLFFDPTSDEVVDYVCGQADLEARVIRAIGEPEKRFAEDHLRLLRAIRFAARLDFSIEPKTWTAMCRHAEEIKRISAERIRMELEGILSHPNRALAIRMLHETAILGYLWPGAEALRSEIETIVRTLAALPATARFESGMAVLLLNSSGAQVVEVCDALRCSYSTKEIVKWLVKEQNALSAPENLTLAALKRLMSHQTFQELMSQFSAKLTASHQDLRPYLEIEARIKAIPQDQVAPPPLLTGHDLSAMGLAPGPRYKLILDQVYDAQLNGNINERDEAIALAKDFLEKQNKNGSKSS